MSAVEVCPDCDIADCRHIRERRAAAKAPPMSTTSELVERLKSLADVIPLRTPNAYTAGDIDVLFYAAASLQKIDELERENARLKRELVKIAASKTAAELDEDQYDSADFEGGYGILIDIARAALAGSGEK